MIVYLVRGRGAGSERVESFLTRQEADDYAAEAARATGFPHRVEEREAGERSGWIMRIRYTYLAHANGENDNATVSEQMAPSGAIETELTDFGEGSFRALSYNTADDARNVAAEARERYLDSITSNVYVVMGAACEERSFLGVYTTRSLARQANDDYNASGPRRRRPNAEVFRFALDQSAGVLSAPSVDETLQAEHWIEEIRQERERQDGQWGGAEHDDSRVACEWTWLIARRLRVASTNCATDAPRYREALVKIASVAVAALQSFDRLHAPQDGAL